MKRKTSCDYLKIIATFAVIMNHVAASNWYSTDVNGIEWHCFNFYEGIVRWAVPVFVMVSGSLFLNREISVKEIYSKYILRLVIAYFTWGFLYALMTPETIEYGISYVLSKHVNAILLGHYHMWFIKMIIGLYMCIPIYRRIVANESVMKYFIILAFVFSIFVPWMFKLLDDYVAGYNEMIKKIISTTETSVSELSMHTVLGYSVFFVLGYYLDVTEIEKRIRMIIYTLGLTGLVFTVLVDLNLALKTQQPCNRYYGVFDVNTTFEAISIFVWFKYRKYNSARNCKYAAIISKYMFGTYLIHVFFIGIFSFVFGFDTLSFNTLISVPAISGIVFICSLLVSAVLNRIPIIRKYCV